MYNMAELYHKYKNTKDPLIYESILQWYLISISFRDVALIEPRGMNYTNTLDFFDTHNIPWAGFLYKNSDKYAYIVIYNRKKIKKENLFKNRDYISIAKSLGTFYKCASNTFYTQHSQRIVLVFNDVEIYAQQCTKKTLQANLAFIHKLFVKLCSTFYKLDPNIQGQYVIYPIHRLPQHSHEDEDITTDNPSFISKLIKSLSFW